MEQIKNFFSTIIDYLSYNNVQATIFLLLFVVFHLLSFKLISGIFLGVFLGVNFPQIVIDFSNKLSVWFKNVLS